MELSNFNKLRQAIDNGSMVIINNIGLMPYIVEKKENMRLDLISYKLYNDVKYITELAYLNGITNVLSIKEGDLLFVTDEESITQVFDFSLSVVAEIKDAILKQNKHKIGKKDNKRISNNILVEQNKRLPPTILNNDKVVIENGMMKLKPNF